MNSESKVVVELWDLVRDHIPSAKRLDTAISFLRIFEEYGFESRELGDITDEDVYLSRAYVDLYSGDEDEEDEDGYGEE
jgi:hypothetical protein